MVSLVWCMRGGADSDDEDTDVDDGVDGDDYVHDSN